MVARLGKVILIGAGPGEARLLALRAAEALRQADVIIVDSTVEDLARQFARPEARVEIVEPEMEEQTLSGRVASMLTSEARRGAKVVRLHERDPFLTGEGALEALQCSAERIPFEIIPTLSAMLAGPVCAGIPLLQRGVARSVIVVDGPYSEAHRFHKNIERSTASTSDSPSEKKEQEAGKKKPGVIIRRRKKRGAADASPDAAVLKGPQPAATSKAGPDPDFWSPDDTVYSLNDPPGTTPVPPPPTEPPPAPTGKVLDREGRDWLALCSAAHTLVFLRAGHSLDVIRTGLLLGGRSPGEPVAVIVKGATLQQSTHMSTIENMVRELAPEIFDGTALLVVGDAVNLRRSLNFFEERPLLGQRVVLLEGEEKGEERARSLEQFGASVEVIPLTSRRPIAGIGELLMSMRDDLRLATFMVFSDAPTATAFFNGMKETKLDVRVIQERCEIIAADDATQEVVHGRSVQSTKLEGGFSAARLLDYLDLHLKGERVLFFGEIAGQLDMTQELRLRGAVVTGVPMCYQQPVRNSLSRLRERLRNREVDVLVAATAMSLEKLEEVWNDEEMDALLSGLLVATLTPEAAAAARAIELEPDIELDSEELLVEALADKENAPA